MATDPEESSLYAFREQPTLVDFPGYMAAVFFVSGCNLDCGYCHNPSLLRRRQVGLSWERLGEVCDRFMVNWTRAAVITGGEPTLSKDLPEIIAFFKSLGWRVKLDTNGSRPDVLASVAPSLDYIAMDVKAGLSRYRELTGLEEVERITESITLLMESSTDYELRTTLIDPFHDDDQLREIADMVRGAARYVLQPFVPREDIPREEFRRLPRCSPDRLQEARAIVEGCADEVLIRGE